jgi:DNA-directed RNA polymerase sigma subunit (sigma70/sigma32)
MKDCLNLKIETALKDKNIVNIMNKASKRFCNQLDSDSIYTCHINALWKAFLHFDPNRNVKFTTYLYNGVFIECLKEVKFVNKGKNFNKKLHENIPEKRDPYFLIDLLDEINDNDKELILDKFSNMTIEEMANKRNSNRETTRKKLKSLFSKLRKKIF